MFKLVQCEAVIMHPDEAIGCYFDSNQQAHAFIVEIGPSIHDKSIRCFWTAHNVGITYILI